MRIANLQCCDKFIFTIQTVEILAFLAAPRRVGFQCRPLYSNFFGHPIFENNFTPCLQPCRLLNLLLHNNVFLGYLLAAYDFSCDRHSNSTLPYHWSRLSRLPISPREISRTQIGGIDPLVHPALNSTLLLC